MNVRCAVISGTGKKRKDNQDNFFFDGCFIQNVYHTDTIAHEIQISDSELHVFAVADGMGGEAYGDLASYIVVKNMKTIEARTHDCLSNFVRTANREICDEIIAHGGSRMGSTLALVAIENGDATLLNIGDSRIYLYRSSKLLQISVDHTTVGQMVKMGILTEEQGKKHPRRHELTQHLGIFEDEMIIEPYITTGSFIAGDVVLLCSDGLTDMLENQEMESIINENISLEEKTKKMFNAAMNAGGKDNITAMLIEFFEKE